MPELIGLPVAVCSGRVAQGGIPPFVTDSAGLELRVGMQCFVHPFRSARLRLAGWAPLQNGRSAEVAVA